MGLQLLLEAGRKKITMHEVSGSCRYTRRKPAPITQELGEFCPKNCIQLYGQCTCTKWSAERQWETPNLKGTTSGFHCS
jgi:hypothetical protein